MSKQHASLIAEHIKETPLFEPILNYYTSIFKKIDSHILVEPVAPSPNNWCRKVNGVWIWWQQTNDSQLIAAYDSGTKQSIFWVSLPMYEGACVATDLELISHVIATHKEAWPINYDLTQTHALSEQHLKNKNSFRKLRCNINFENADPLKMKHSATLQAIIRQYQHKSFTDQWQYDLWSTINWYTQQQPLLVSTINAVAHIRKYLHSNAFSSSAIIKHDLLNMDTAQR